MQKTVSLFVLLMTSLTLTNCSLVYRPDVQQGNIITQAKLQQLKPGMSAEQVRFVMGTPLLVNTFKPNRWDYVYTLQQRHNPTQEQRVVLHFAQGHLVQFPKTLPDQMNIH